MHPNMLGTKISIILYGRIHWTSVGLLQALPSTDMVIESEAHTVFSVICGIKDSFLSSYLGTNEQINK